jgi:hypothetical protein
MHVFEHFNDPFKVLGVMKKHLSPNGKIIIEVPHFGGYHHQHLYFYNLQFLDRLCKDNKMKIIDYEIQNSSLHIVVTHEYNQQYDSILIPNSLKWSLEKAHDYFSNFHANVKRINELLKKSNGKKIFWWGAGSSSVIYLNQIDKTVLDQLLLIVIDGDSNKWGRYIPGFRGLQVLPYNVITDQVVEVVIIASSFHREIMNTMEKNHIIASYVEYVC